MLDACAPGWSRELKLHHWWVRYGPFTFRALPKGRGRGDDDAEVQAGKVRQMARQLQLESECVKKHLGLEIGLAKPGPML
jgi:hypothetical protein